MKNGSRLLKRKPVTTRRRSDATPSARICSEKDSLGARAKAFGTGPDDLVRSMRVGDVVLISACVTSPDEPGWSVNT